MCQTNTEVDLIEGQTERIGSPARRLPIGWTVLVNDTLNMIELDSIWFLSFREPALPAARETARFSSGTFWVQRERMIPED